MGQDGDAISLSTSKRRGSAVRHQLDERSGFTLIELMIAVAILATLVVATASIMTVSTRNNQISREEAAALRAAKAMISELQAYSSTEIMAGYSGGYTFRVTLVEGQTQTLREDEDAHQALPRPV